MNENLEYVNGNETGLTINLVSIGNIDSSHDFNLRRPTVNSRGSVSHVSLTQRVRHRLGYHAGASICMDGDLSRNNILLLAGLID